MPRYRVKTLRPNMSLPDGRIYPDPQIVTLTEDQYVNIDPISYTRGCIQDLGVVQNEGDMGMSGVMAAGSVPVGALANNASTTLVLVWGKAMPSISYTVILSWEGTIMPVMDAVVTTKTVSQASVLVKTRAAIPAGVLKLCGVAIPHT